VEAGRVRYDGVQAKRCLDALSTQCDPGDACKLVFTGTLALGAACHTSPECGGDAWCDRSNVCPGVCAAREGDGAIVSHFDACSSQSAVFESDGGIRCVARRSAGAACTENIQCEQGLTCRGGQCSAAPTEGQACDDGRCATGLRCDQDVCARWARRGEPCANEFTDGAQCQIGLACRDGICGDALGEGESCRNNANRCAAGTHCISESGGSVCRRRGSEGVACSSLFDCDTNLSCSGGQCTALRAAGGACTGSSDCQLGLSCLEGKCAVPVCSR
jgi:hypothetical protein